MRVACGICSISPMGVVTSTVFTGQYLPRGRSRFNKINGLSKQPRTAREPLLARCDNACRRVSGHRLRFPSAPVLRRGRHRVRCKHGRAGGQVRFESSSRRPWGASAPSGAASRRRIRVCSYCESVVTAAFANWTPIPSINKLPSKGRKLWLFANLPSQRRRRS
jgi:hypothetical protein